MTERRSVTLGDRWRRITTAGVDDTVLEKALEALPSIRKPRLRVVPGSIQAEMEGAMGSINEVSIHVPRLQTRIWPQVIRVLRRSASMQDALRAGRVPRSFDRLIARISGEALLPEPRRVSSACSCSDQEVPCRHIQALHEQVARRLDDKPWELLILRGVELRELLREAAEPLSADLPPLAFGAREEPVLFPEGERGDFDSILTPGQVRSLLGSRQASLTEYIDQAIRTYIEAPRESLPEDAVDE